MTTPEEAFPYPDTSPELVDFLATSVHKVHEVLVDTRADVDDGNLLLTSSWGGYAAQTCVDDVTVMTGLLQSDAGHAATGLTALRTYKQAIIATRASIDKLRTQYQHALDAQTKALLQIPGQLPDDDKQQARDGVDDDFHAATGSLFIAYGYLMQGHGGDSAIARNALVAVVDALSPQSYRQSPTGGEPDVDVGAYTDVGVSLSLVMTLDASPDADRRKAQLQAYQKTFPGQIPSGPEQWRVAGILDPTSYDSKNGGVPAVIQVGHVTPQPGRGLVRIGWYIPIKEVLNVPHWDLGDDRDMDPDFDPEQTRVALYIDYETGTVIVRQNPSVSTAGDVEVGTPEIKVQQNGQGQIRLTYDASNALAPPGGNATGHTVNGDIVVTPGDPPSVSGTIGDYPSLEIYHDNALGQTQTILQDPADSYAPDGPLIYLTQHHEVGPDGAAAVDPFYDDPNHTHIGPRNPHLLYPDRYPDTTLGDPEHPPTVVTVP